MLLLSEKRIAKFIVPARTRGHKQKPRVYIDRCTQAYPYSIPFDMGLRVLEGALAIGRQAGPLGVEDVTARMEAVQANATTLTSVAGRPFFSKVKSWITMKETHSAA